MAIARYISPLHAKMKNYYFKSVADALDVYNSTYDKFLLAGDFNAEENEITISTFLDSYGLKSLVKENTCFKSPRKPRCLDLFYYKL